MTNRLAVTLHTKEPDEWNPACLPDTVNQLCALFMYRIDNEIEIMCRLLCGPTPTLSEGAGWVTVIINCGWFGFTYIDSRAGELIGRQHRPPLIQYSTPTQSSTRFDSIQPPCVVVVVAFLIPPRQRVLLL